VTSASAGVRDYERCCEHGGGAPPHIFSHCWSMSGADKCIKLIAKIFSKEIPNDDMQSPTLRNASTFPANDGFG
jgi:hypothetical protein